MDPGLLQVTQGTFQAARIHFRQRSRIVAVTYSESLVARGLRGIYRLPLDYAATVGEFSLAVSVRGSTSRPVARGNAWQAIAFSGNGSDYQLKVDRRDHAPQGTLEVAVGLPSGPRTLIQTLDGRDISMPSFIGTRKAERMLPHTVGIIWDSSWSGATRNHAREPRCWTLISRMRGEVRLTRIRNIAEPTLRFTVVDGDWHAPRRVETTIYDGATDLSAFRRRVRRIPDVQRWPDNFGDGTCRKRAYRFMRFRRAPNPIRPG